MNVPLQHASARRHKDLIARYSSILAALALLAATFGASGTLRAAANAGFARYSVTDLGTFGGPDTQVQNGAGIRQRGEINNAGFVAGAAQTPQTDPLSPSNCYNNFCRVEHAFLWDGKLRDLGALPGNSSQAWWVSGNGRWVIGVIANGKVVPVSNFLVNYATVWHIGPGSKVKMHVLGAFGGALGSSAAAVNNSGQVVGNAHNKIPFHVSTSCGPPPPCDLGTEARPFLWQKGKMINLGTLHHGPDAWAGFINNKGQVAGASFTNRVIHKATGMPTQLPFIWQKGKMTSLGSLGGTSGYPTDMNDKGQIVGQSDLKGDQSFHAFIWKASAGTRGLPTLGGDSASVAEVNENGVVAGWANDTQACPGCTLPYPGLPTSQAFHAVMWRGGKVTDLGALPGDLTSFATGINLRGQIIGVSRVSSGPPSHPFLWQEGRMTNLNTLVQNGDPHLLLKIPEAIDNRGDIVVEGLIPVGDGSCTSTGESTGYCQHTFLLQPVK